MSAPILLTGGRLIDGTGAAPVKASLLLEGGAVAALGAAADQAAQGRNDVERVDCSGKVVMPGLIDSHCHISFDEPGGNDELFFHRREGLAAIIAAANVRKLLRAGVTAFFDADTIYEVSLDLRDAIEARIIDGPRMTAGGNALITSVGGTAGRLIPDDGRRGYGVVVRTRDEIVMEVRRQIKNGVDWVKVHVTGIVPRNPEAGELQAFNYDELRLICDTAHELGIPVTGHCRNAGAIRDAARAGFDMILHATHMDEAALEAIIEAKAAIVPTLTFQANLADYGDRVGATEDVKSIFRKEIEDSVAMLRKAYEAGVPLMCGSEAGFALTPYGEWHHREMEVFVEHLGMSPLEAITCATRNNARALKMMGKIGLIAEGALADVIVVDGDPSKDVGVLGRPGAITHVFLGGRPIDLTPEPQERGDPPGWRPSSFAQHRLTRARAGLQ